ncbi:MAG: glycosyltransferase family 4 protein [candidate division WOR-3 bacterium]|nr:MAG: glycosyltransferase family 4 protein [candidate division WOR-3 bacterium]
MNILVVNWQDWANPFAGGAEVYLYEIFSRLAKNGHNIILLCSRARGQSRHEFIDGFEIFRVGGRANFNFVAPLALRSILRHRLVDVVVDDLNKIPFFSTFVTRKRVVPTLMHLFRGTIFRETNPIFASYVYIAERLISIFYRRSNFVAISESTAQDLRDIGVKRRISIVYCGIPRNRGHGVEKREDDLVAYVGRVKTYKSIDHFVRAVAMVKKRRNIRAKIVGDGDALDDLKSLARERGVDIDFTGFVSGDEKYRVYRSARVVVQPSIKEGWGLTAIEAQSCSTPVVSANSPGLREVVVHGKTGFLYEYGNVEEMAERIIELLDDRRKWVSFSRAAEKWARQFSWDRSARMFEHVLKREGEGDET